ncbi:hypothetical protein K2W90_00170 [Candidatus Babeliales bacterium]|nr:hypothetical protein [Candidatus Babeliales bacterium]
MKRFLFCALLACSTLNASPQQELQSQDITQLIAALSEQQQAELVHELQLVLDNETETQTARCTGPEIAGFAFFGIFIAALLLLRPEMLCDDLWLSANSPLCKIASVINKTPILGYRA